MSVFSKTISADEKGEIQLLQTSASLRDYTKEETEFAIFCVENVARYLHVDASVIYDAFTRGSDILDNYIISCYDILHTQGKEYIVNDLIDLMREKGVML